FKEFFFVSDEELIRRNIESLKDQREALKEAFDFTDILSGTTGTGQIKREFDRLIGDVEGNFDRLVQLAENKADLDKIRQGLTEFLEELAPNDPQIEVIKRQIQKVNEVLKSYSITQENKSLSDAARERKKILEQLNKMEAETFVKGFDKRQQEIEKVKLQFQELRDAAKQAGLGAGVQERIDRLEERRTGDITYRSETDLLKSELEKRKSLYQDYEMFAKDFGIQAAEERYSKELDLAKSYLDLIQQEYDKLSESRPEDRTGAQNERLEFLEKELEAEKRVQQKKYDDFLKTLQDYETQRAQITERYQLERQRLIESGDTEYLNQLTENYNTEIGELDDANARKLWLYRQFFRGLDTLSVSASKKLISDLRGSLELLRSQGRITESFYRDMLDRLNQAELQTNMRIPNGLKSIAQEFSNISNEIGGVNKGLGVMFGILGNSLNRVADIKANIAQFDLASKANGGKGDFFGMASAGLGIFGAGISIAQTIAGVVKSSLDKQLEVQKKQLEFQRKILFGELEISRVQRERALEQAEVNGNTLATLKEQRSVVEDNYNRIADDINKIEGIFGKDIQKNILDDINRYYGFYKSERDKKIAELANSLYIDGTETVRGGLFGLGKETINIYKSLAGLTFDQIENLSLKGQLTEEAEKLFQELKKLKEEGADLEQQLKDIEDQMKAIFTGNATALGIADSIIAGFQQGKRAVEDFGDDIEEILRNAILSGFKYRFLEAPLNALLEQLYQDAVSNDELSASEIGNFQDQFGKIVEEYSKVFEDLQAATGIDLSGITQGQKGLAGAIRREMTEATAGELAGLFRGNFDINKRHFQVAQDSLQVQIAIERNTFETVQELKSLIRINQDIRFSLSTQSSRDLGLNE
ncbi:MAG: hypothetical protein LPJ98_07315, partial [Cyclobacteriaceae bacterium]|nr:hypothetical protein [Cyclobacteriaceae bacterium]